jgi:ribonuclease Z
VALRRDGDGDKGRLVFLGTGSAIPSKYRNVSATWLELTGGALLMDAGEGTLGQMARLIGRKAVQDAVDQLRCVYISHMHADHHLGLVRVLLARAEGAPDLWVVGPPTLRLWLAEYTRIEPLRYA